MPRNIDEFVNMRDSISIKPEGAALIFLLAVKIYTENKILGEKCLVASIEPEMLCKGKTYKGYSLSGKDKEFIDKQIFSEKYLPDSYIKGSSPYNFYKTEFPFTYEFSTNKYCGDPETGKFKVFVKCSGADYPRPIIIKKNEKGIWKVYSWRSIFMSIKKPIVSDSL